MKLRINKGMTVQQAVRMEKSLIVLAKKSKTLQEELRAAVRNFRTSGAWAITPQHHRTFSKWCFYMAATTGLSPYTLQSYGCPNFVKNQERGAKEMEDTIMFTGEAARLMRKAIKLACSITGRHTSKRRTKWAGILIARFYLQEHGVRIKKAA